MKRLLQAIGALLIISLWIIPLMMVFFILGLAIMIFYSGEVTERFRKPKYVLTKTNQERSSRST